MRYSIVLFNIILTFSYGIQLHISPDRNISIQQEDIDALKYFTKEKYRFIMNNEGAKKIVKENRILANAYIKEGLLTPFQQKVLLIETEKNLADQYVKHLQQTVQIPEKVLKSYYFDNLEKFKELPQVKLMRYRFKTYKDAIAFYMKKRKNIKFNKMKESWKSLNKIKEPYRSIFLVTKKGQYTPVFVVGKDKFDIFYIEDKKEGKGYLPFEKVKKDIAKFLYAKTFNRARAKVLEQYE